jgi:outer membrane protein assembly factor BamA
LLALGVATLAPTAAHAEDTIAPPPRGKTEVTAVPLVGGDSDIGIGGGALVAVARTDSRYVPYRWGLESTGLITFKSAPSGGVDVPYQDYVVKLTLPHLVKNRLRLELRGAFHWLSSVKYYGLGNDSHIDPPLSNLPSEHYYQYGRIDPSLRARLRLTLAGGLHLVSGAAYTQNWIEAPADGKLAADMRSGSPAVKALLGDTAPHGVLKLEYGVVFDRRDDEISTKRGVFHQAVVRLSPGGAGLFLPYRFGEANVTVRFFVPLGTPRVVLALRGVVDLLFGNVPFYELALFDDTNAIGGVSGVRGVPAQRYYGKAKVFGNLELRTEVAHFRIFKKKYVFGIVGFFDAGRVWADYTRRPELDGTGLGLKYGVGGGLRLQSGRSFVLRADVAWSPDALPVGAYFGAGQMF